MPKLTLKDKINLYYEIFGPDLQTPDVKTIIFIHGGPGLLDGRSYYEFWQQFVSTEVRVIFPDQRGSGRSDDPADITTLNIQQHAQDIHELCEKLGIENPIVAGVSQGAYVSLSYAEQFPDEIGGLIISNSEAKRDTDERVKAYKYSLEEFFGLSKTEATALSEEIRKFDAKWDWKPYEAMFGKYYSKKGEEFEIALHETTWNKFMGEEFGNFDLTPGLANITCKVLYMAGEFDCVHPAACAEKTQKLMKNAEVDFHIVKQSADPVYVDQWVLAKDLVSSFVQELMLTCSYNKCI